MKLYQSVGPNPRVVTLFVAEKGVAVERVFVDIQAGENRQPTYLAINPHGGTPSLALDDGSHLSESVAICEYLEETQSGPSLIGATPAERAATRAMTRWIDQMVVVPMSSGFRSAEGLPMFKDRLLCVPEAAEGNKAYARDGLTQVDGELGDKEWLMGNRFSLADILLFAFVDFGGAVGQPIPDGLSKLKAWAARVAARPSAALSADPKNGVA